MSGKSAQIKGFKEPFEINSVPIPTPGEGEVVIKMKVAPVDPADIFSFLGVYPGFVPPSFPTTLGLEGVGFIHALGSGVNNFKVGERVAPILSDLPRSFQQYVLIQAKRVISVPEKISDESASQLVINPLTVAGMLDKLNLQKGDFLVQSAAGSEVGRMVIQVSNLKGIKTINLVRRKEQVEELKKFGGTEVIWTGEENLTEKIKEATGGKGADGALDCVVGELTGKIFSALKDDSTLLIYGLMSGLSFTASGLDPLFRGCKIDGYWVAKEINKMLSKDDPKLQKMIEDVKEWYAKIENFGGHVGETFKLEEINQAFAASQKEAKPGKVLVYME